MKKQRNLFIALFASLLIFALYAFSGPVSAKIEYSKQTGKKCAFCHEGAPKDKKLTKEGQCFKDSGFKQGTCW